MVHGKEVFNWKDISILQSDEVFKVGTDAILLGAWVPAILKSAGSILDVGTGSGILAVMLGSFYPDAAIDAIDMDENAVQLANQNFKRSIASDRLRVKKENLFKFIPPGSGKYELIVSNPPYFLSQLAARRNRILNAKHAKDPATSWMKSFASLLMQNGHVFLVLPYDITFEWIRAGNDLGLYCQDRLDIYSFERDTAPTRSLLHFRDQLEKPVFRQLTIYDERLQYTDAYISFSGISPREKQV